MDDEDERHGRTGGPTFDPPVYRQRYKFVEDIVRETNAKKVIDFGCSECKLISKLKTVECVEELVGIDIDEDVLEFNQIKARPFTADYLDPRPNPLTVSLFKGSIGVCDERFVDYDVIACVEIIEHLHPPELEAMPSVVFGQLAPKIVIVTTPNSEFNVLFPDLKGFRHYDHKFEWTRSQFQTWCLQACTKYGYTVTFSGVGQGPVGTEHLGHCSQIGVFLRNDELSQSRKTVPAGQRPYLKVISCVHPFEKPKTTEECIIEELDYHILMLAGEYQTEPHSKQSIIPLERLLDFRRITNLTQDIDFIRTVASGCPKFQLNEDETAIVYTRPPSDWPSDDEDQSNWDSEGVGACYAQYYNVDNPTSECWDDEMESDDVSCHSKRLVLLVQPEGDQGATEASNWTNWREQAVDAEERRVVTEDDEIFADTDFTW